MSRRAVGRKVIWQHSRFGWDAVLLDARGRSVNAINYGFKNEPTAAQKAEAIRVLRPQSRKAKGSR